MGSPDADRVYRVWERFVSTGVVDDGHVAGFVGESWRRCRHAGLDPRAPKVPVRQSREELAETISRNVPFIEAALPFIQFLESAVRGTGYVLILTEESGIVLEAFGDEDLIARARANNYVPGCCRSEEEVGTNAIGLALLERRPVQLSGAEHYNVRHHRWTCASSPVFSPSGALLGSVTLSGETNDPHPHTLGMVISAAEAIQNRLREHRLVKQMGESEKLTESLLKSMSDAIITVNQDGEIVYVNKPAAALIGLSQDHLTGRRVTSLFVAEEFGELLRTQGDAPPFEAAFESDGRRVYVVIKPFVIRESDGVLGAILAISRRREFLKNVRGMSGFTARYSLDDIVGRDIGLRRQVELASVVARQDSRVLIAGETGTGKELIAHGIHNASLRAPGPFVALNCAAIPRDLIEAELFGYKDGAFTGARRSGQIGKLELADGGTLFLDEISQMPMDMQAKLLRVLQDGIVTQLGDDKPVTVDVRIVAATNEDLFTKSRLGQFRSDLYFRLSVVEIALPPLRERGEDVILLVETILTRLRERLDMQHLAIDEEAQAVLRSYAWPGNIRELENVLETAAIMSATGMIGVNALPPRLLPVDTQGGQLGFGAAVAGGSASTGAVARDRKARSPIDVMVRNFEADAIRRALREHNCNISKVSRSLGLSRSTVYRKMRDIGISLTVDVI